MEISKAIDFIVIRFGKKEKVDYLPQQFLFHLPWIEKNEEEGGYCFGWEFAIKPRTGNWPPKRSYIIFKFLGWLCFEYRDFREKSKVISK